MEFTRVSFTFNLKQHRITYAATEVGSSKWSLDQMQLLPMKLDRLKGRLNQMQRSHSFVFLLLK